MRVLLLLLTAFVTAGAMPTLVYGLQPELLPFGGSVTEGWDDLGVLVRLLRQGWETDQPPPEPEWEEMRYLRAVTIGGTAAIWLVGFLPAGLLGLLLLNVRRTTLAVVAVVVALGLYSCSQIKVTHNLSPETIKMVTRFAGLFLVAALAGFVTARSFRRVVV